MRSNCLSLVLLALVIPAIALGCKRNSPNSGAQGGAGGSAIQVVAVEARQQSIVETISLIGSIAANEMIEVKAEMDGIVREINFKEGQKVQKGETLVVLDETKLAAELAEGEANFRLSQTSFSRTQQLLRDKFAGKVD